MWANLKKLTISTYHFTVPLKLVSAIFKRHISSLFRTKYIEKKFNLQLFFLPTVSRTLFYSLLGYPRLLETSCLEKITVCVIETMLVTLPLVQMNKAQREVNRTNQVQTKINIVKGLQTSVIHLIPGSTCH